MENWPFGGLDSLSSHWDVSFGACVSSCSVIVIIVNVSLEEGASFEDGEKEECTCVTAFGLCLDSAQLGDGKQQTLIFHCGYRILRILPHLRRRKAGRKGSQIPQEALSPFCGLFPWTAASSSEFQNGFSMAAFSRMYGVGIKEVSGSVFHPDSHIYRSAKGLCCGGEGLLAGLRSCSHPQQLQVGCFQASLSSWVKMEMQGCTHCSLVSIKSPSIAAQVLCS